jgi:hypothetical protein
MSKPLFIGELNPYGADPEFALYPSPPGCSGDRLCRVVLGLDPDEYLERFARTNLCAGKWSLPAARARAREIKIAMSRGDFSVVVLLGAKVAAAWGVKFLPFVMTRRALVLPHPSGRNTRWNSPGEVAMARQALRVAGVLS